MLTDVKVKVTEHGESALGKVRAGYVLRFEEEWHEVENLGMTNSRAYIIDLKSASWKPSTN